MEESSFSVILSEVNAASVRADLGVSQEQPNHPPVPSTLSFLLKGAKTQSGH